MGSLPWDTKKYVEQCIDGFYAYHLGFNKIASAIKKKTYFSQV